MASNPFYLGAENLDSVSASYISGILALAHGGTGADLSAVTPGAVVYHDGAEFAVTAAGSAGQVLVSNGTSAPSWSGLVSGVSSVTAGTGLTASPTTGAVVVALATPVAVSNGGTGLSSWTNFAVPYASAGTTISQVSPNTSTIAKYLRQLGDGTFSAAPSWSQIPLSELKTDAGDGILWVASNVMSGAPNISTTRKFAYVVGNGVKTTTVAVAQPDVSDLVTSINAILKGNGSTIVAAVAGTDYVASLAAGSNVTVSGSSGALTVSLPATISGFTKVSSAGFQIPSFTNPYWIGTDSSGNFISGYSPNLTLTIGGLGIVNNDLPLLSLIGVLGAATSGSLDSRTGSILNSLTGTIARLSGSSRGTTYQAASGKNATLVCEDYIQSIVQIQSGSSLTTSAGLYIDKLTRSAYAGTYGTITSAYGLYVKAPFVSADSNKATNYGGAYLESVAVGSDTLGGALGVGDGYFTGALTGNTGRISSLTSNTLVKTTGGNGTLASTVSTDYLASLSVTANQGLSISPSPGTGAATLSWAPTGSGVLHNGSPPSYSAVSLTTDVSGLLPMANGGTNASLTASNGKVAYSSASAIALTAVGAIGQVLTSAGAATPLWAGAYTLIPGCAITATKSGVTPVTPTGSNPWYTAGANGSAATDFNITGISSAYSNIRLVYNLWSVNTTTSDYVQIRLNADTSGAYAVQVTSSFGGTVSCGNWGSGINYMDGTGAGVKNVCSGMVEIFNCQRTTNQYQIYTSGSSTYAVNSGRTSTGGGYWNGTATVTQIGLRYTPGFDNSASQGGMMFLVGIPV